MASRLTRRTALSVEHELTKSGGPRGRTHHDQRKAPGRRGVRTPSTREKPFDTLLSLTPSFLVAKATIRSKEERSKLSRPPRPPLFPIIIPIVEDEGGESKRKEGRLEFHERGSVNNALKRGPRSSALIRRGNISGSLR